MHTATANPLTFNSTVPWTEMVSHRSYLVRFAQRKLRDPLMAEDAVHDVFEAVLSGRAVFAGRAALRSWLTAVLKNKIVDLVRQRQAERHGGGALHLTLTGDVAEQAALPAGEEHILRVHEALEELAKVDPRMAQVVEMRYFAGLSDAEIAGALDVGDRTVRRDWEHARLLLAQALK